MKESPWKATVLHEEGCDVEDSVKDGAWVGTVAETTRVSPLCAKMGRADESKRTIRTTTSSLLISAISHGFAELSNKICGQSAKVDDFDTTSTAT